MFFLAIIKSEAFITLISGLIIAIVVFVLYNSSWVIRKKKKAEAIQKLKLDSIIEVINGVEELQSVVAQIGILMFDIIRGVLRQIQEQNYSQTNEALNEANYNFLKESNVYDKKIKNFAFLLKKEFVINKKMSREQDLIKEEYLKIDAMREEMADAIDGLKNFTISQHNINDIITEIVDQINEINHKANKFSTQIIKIYEIKLDKEQEILLGNILKIIGFLKIVNWVNFLLRNRENENKLEEILKEMEQKEEPSANEQSEASA